MRSIAVLLLCLCFQSPLLAAVKLEQHTLKNGLTIYVKQDHRAPIIVTQIWYKVGSAYEPGGRTGLSHLLEHLMFDGTKNYPDDAFAQSISKRGGKLNAFTTQDFTTYYEKMSVDDLELSLKLEADRMQNLMLTPKQFNKEIKVVREERRLRTDDQPQAIAYERFNAQAYMTTPYHHPVVGWMNDLQHLTLQDAQTWYQQWYAPNNAFILVVGDVQPERVFKLAEKYFANIKSNPVLAKLKPQTEPPQLGPRQVIIHTPAKVPWLLMGFATPSLTVSKDPQEVYALTVAAYLLGGGNSSRLEKNLVRGQQLATSISVNYDPASLFAQQFLITATPAPGVSVKKLQQAILQQINAVKTEDIKPDELARIKAQVIANQTYQMDSMVDQGVNIGKFISVGLPWSLINEFPNKIERVTPQQIKQVVKQFLKVNNSTTAILKPKQLMPKTNKGQPHV